MTRSHECRDDKQNIFRRNISLRQISKAKDDTMDTKMTPKFIYLALISTVYEGRDDT
jgi:hypothetical protein